MQSFIRLFSRGDCGALPFPMFASRKILAALLLAVLLVRPVRPEYLVAVLANPKPLRRELFEQLAVGPFNRGVESKIDCRFAIQIEHESKMDSTDIPAEELVDHKQSHCSD